MKPDQRVMDYIDGFLKNYRNYKENWNYEDGCVLIGARDMYEAVGDTKYVDFIEKYLKGFITDDGRILNYNIENYNIDNILSGRVLYFMYDRTGEEKYRKAIEVLMDQLRSHPRCSTGNFFHKKIYPDQIWLDGLYMGQPFYMEYETRYDGKEKYNDIIDQFRNVEKYLGNKEKGLNYHACDISKTAFWADKETGCSANFWLRSMGWYMMALIDVMDVMSEEIFEQYAYLRDVFREHVSGLLKYQDPETGLFRQVIDRPDVEGNYFETSGSSMIAYAILKACRKGVLLAEKYEPIGRKIMEGLIEQKLITKDGKTELTGICQVAGLGPESNPVRDGSVEYYLSEKVVSDDSKGVGPFIMAYSEYLKLA